VTRTRRLALVVAAAGLGLVLVAGPWPGRPWDGALPTPPGAASTEPDASYPPPLDAAGVYARFEELGRAGAFGEPVGLSVKDAGDLVLPTGRVVAADVFFFGTEPFIRALPVGSHPVTLLQLEREGVAELGDYREVAAAMIRVAPGNPVSWELALVAGQDPSTLGPDEFFGYGVDSGTGCFASAEAAGAASHSGTYGDEVLARLHPAEDESHNVANIVVDPATGANVIAFPSGFGDGAYPSYFGLDRAGEPLVLLTNFGILDAGD
jgi:hypothetical protein